MLEIELKRIADYLESVAKYCERMNDWMAATNERIKAIEVPIADKVMLVPDEPEAKEEMKTKIKTEETKIVDDCPFDDDLDEPVADDNPPEKKKSFKKKKEPDVEVEVIKPTKIKKAKVSKPEPEVDEDDDDLDF